MMTFSGDVVNPFNFSPWNRVRKSLAKQGPQYLEDRRREWRLVTRRRVQKVMLEAKKEFAPSKLLYLYDSTAPVRHGAQIENFDSIELSSGITPSGICYEYKEHGREHGWERAMEYGGCIVIGQTTHGIIGVLFYPTFVKLPKQEEGKEYVISNYKGCKRKFFVKWKNDIARNKHIVYGHFEPWELTEKKLRQIVSRGICFMHETSPGAKQSFYTIWLLNKDNKFYKGIGVTIAVTIAYDVFKYLLF